MKREAKEKGKKVNENAVGQKGGPNMGDKEGKVTYFLQGLYFFTKQRMLQRHPSACSPPNYSNYHGTL